mmetsp:Transcript_24510/g.68223  ORF Transcript_24510/g.68223 Transcript_24510/m.68223 type:complete len:288 (-) Transcript_24510:1989-2852(-)
MGLEYRGAPHHLEGAFCLQHIQPPVPDGCPALLPDGVAEGDATPTEDVHAAGKVDLLHPGGLLGGPVCPAAFSQLIEERHQAGDPSRADMEGQLRQLGLGAEAWKGGMLEATVVNAAGRLDWFNQRVARENGRPAPHFLPAAPAEGALQEVCLHVPPAKQKAVIEQSLRFWKALRPPLVALQLEETKVQDEGFLRPSGWALATLCGGGGSACPCSPALQDIHGEGHPRRLHLQVDEEPGSVAGLPGGGDSRHDFGGKVVCNGSRGGANGSQVALLVPLHKVEYPFLR